MTFPLISASRDFIVQTVVQIGASCLWASCAVTKCRVDLRIGYPHYHSKTPDANWSIAVRSAFLTSSYFLLAQMFYIRYQMSDTCILKLVKKTAEIKSKHVCIYKNVSMTLSSKR